MGFSSRHQLNILCCVYVRMYVCTYVCFGSSSYGDSSGGTFPEYFSWFPSSFNIISSYRIHKNLAWLSFSWGRVLTAIRVDCLSSFSFLLIIFQEMHIFHSIIPAALLSFVLWMDFSRLHQPSRFYRQQQRFFYSALSDTLFSMAGWVKFNNREWSEKVVILEFLNKKEDRNVRRRRVLSK